MRLAPNNQHQESVNPESIKSPETWQADGTLAQLVGDRGVLTAMLEPLCGWGCDKEGDAGVRESLAEALMMLVSCMVLVG